MEEKCKFLFILFISFAVIFTIGTSSLYAQQERMRIEDYNIELAKWMERERVAKAEIAKLEKEIADLRSQLNDLDNQIAAMRQEIYRLLGYSQRQIDAFRKELESLRQQIMGLLKLSLEELYDRLGEVERIGKRLEEMAADKRAKLPEIATILRDVQSVFERLKARAAQAKPRIETYTVIRGDYLWKIAGKPNIYADPYQWMRIYSFNRDEIKNPDLIFPNQIFKIHRIVEKGQYLVSRGDFLRKIAGLPEVYNDPFQWKKIYEANNTIIRDPNLIYPHTVLFIP